MTVRFRPLALDDVRETVGFLETNGGVEVAERYFRAVMIAAESLTSLPNRGAPCLYARKELEGLRRVPVEGFDRWRIFYFVREGGVEVVRVLHTARDIGGIFR